MFSILSVIKKNKELISLNKSCSDLWRENHEMRENLLIYKLTSDIARSSSAVEQGNHTLKVEGSTPSSGSKH